MSLHDQVLPLQMVTQKRLSTLSVALSCTFLTVTVIAGAIFATYLLTRLDLLQKEVNKSIALRPTNLVTYYAMLT